MLSRLREPINGLTHLGGAIAAVFGLIALLVIGWHSPDRLLSVLVYGLSLIALFSASAAYHLLKATPKGIGVLRKLDHSAIYLLIAGTYTPFCLLAFNGFFRWGLLIIIWSIALIGIVIKIRLGRLPRWINAGGYVIMGWLCVAAIGQMTSTLPPSILAWLAVGGVIYTLGAVVYATKILNFAPGKFGFHEVWHIFVLLGALAHFISVMLLVAPRQV